MKEKFLRNAKHEYSSSQRTITLIIAGVVFLGILPYALITASHSLDARFALPNFYFGLINIIAGSIMTAGGFLLGWWSNYVQFTIGRGTPVPIMATQQLIIQKPYEYCRNPMALGAILAYLGTAVLVGSISAAVLVLVFATLLLTYIRFLEEKEMELRFGEAYQEYRRQTPFIIPRLWKRK